MHEPKCDTCINARPIVSENGLHYTCTLSGRKPLLCMADDRYYEHIIRPDDIANAREFGKRLSQAIMAEVRKNG